MFLHNVIMSLLVVVYIVSSQVLTATRRIRGLSCIAFVKQFFQLFLHSNVYIQSDFIIQVNFGAWISWSCQELFSKF